MSEINSCYPSSWISLPGQPLNKRELYRIYPNIFEEFSPTFNASTLLVDVLALGVPYKNRANAECPRRSQKGASSLLEYTLRLTEVDTPTQFHRVAFLHPGEHSLGAAVIASYLEIAYYYDSSLRIEHVDFDVIPEIDLVIADCERQTMVMVTSLS